MKSKKWTVKAINLMKIKISNDRAEQLLAEVGEILYNRLCQHVRSKSESPEPAKLELEETQFKKAASL